MTLLRNQLPPGAVWAAFGISRHEFPMAAQAVILGGHVRVGLEDNLYIEQGKLSPGNAPLVARAVQIIEAVGERPATVAETREIPGIQRPRFQPSSSWPCGFEANSTPRGFNLMSSRRRALRSPDTRGGYRSEAGDERCAARFPPLRGSPPGRR